MGYVVCGYAPSQYTYTVSCMVYGVYVFVCRFYCIIVASALTNAGGVIALLRSCILVP